MEAGKNTDVFSKILVTESIVKVPSWWAQLYKCQFFVFSSII